MIKQILVVLITMQLAVQMHAQSYTEEMDRYREQYKQEFLHDARSPLKAEQLAGIRFYEPDSTYRVNAVFTATKDSIGFEMMTHNRVPKKYYVYGQVQFQLKGSTYTLRLYQSDKLKHMAGMEDELFLPFTDETNYRETFGGGRYLDFHIPDIKDGRLVIDFNKCYNPYCAYAEGYACPIPPRENDMPASVRAGEKLFVQPWNGQGE